MCGREYPPKTMSDKPPRHEEYTPPLPSSIAPAILRLAKDEDAARSQGNRALANAKYNEAEDLVKSTMKTGIATAYSSRGKTNQVRLPMSGKGTRRNKSTGGDIVTHMLTIRNQVKLYHWQTGSFARHTATDGLTATLDTLIDSFVESYMGRYGRPKVSGSIKLHNFSESAAKSFVAQQTTYLASVLPKKIKSTDTDLLNLRDEILGELNKVLYLFTLA
jgi:hypothetical protein